MGIVESYSNWSFIKTQAAMFGFKYYKNKVTNIFVTLPDIYQALVTKRRRFSPSLSPRASRITITGNRV